MPYISTFFGLLIQMYFDEHNPPHIHVRFQNDKAIFNIQNGDMTHGNLSNRNRRLVQAWIELHRDELILNWELCRNDEQPFKIEPLR
ncbi:MAG: DUF4160 domain-containing protein [Tannerella sp.]|jgi:hypothetical protein|nr:DUF4160 domain-containing protein [Tannerella sp.]